MVFHLTITSTGGDQDDETRALEVLLRFLDGKSVRYPSVSVALCALEAARKYQLPAFQRHSTNFLLHNLTVTNVLEVLPTVFLYSSLNQNKKDGKGSFAPSLYDLEREYLGVTGESQTIRENQMNDANEMFDAVTEKCLELIDREAEAVLRSDAWDMLPLPLVSLILTRDTLQPRSEASVVRALDRWAGLQCVLHGIVPSPSHKRRVLGEVRLEARLLTLRVPVLRLVQAHTGILGPGELEACVRAVLQPRCSCPLPGLLQSKRTRLATFRYRYSRPTEEEEEEEEEERERRQWRKEIWQEEEQEEEGDYASIDGELEEIEGGEYRWKKPGGPSTPGPGGPGGVPGGGGERGRRGGWQRLEEEPPMMRDSRCTCHLVRYSYKQATISGITGYPSGAHFETRIPRMRGRDVRQGGGGRFGCLVYCLACVFD